MTEYIDINKSKKVAVAMSGGIDSSTSAYLLLKKGFQVVGVTAVMSEIDEDAVKLAKKACERMNISHEVIDLRVTFKNTVINYFEDSYKKGLTPNPCTFCNKIIKWGHLKNFVLDELNADFYATGHYARIEQKGGVYKLYRGEDLQKDQSYMLFRLTQSDLAVTIFPLGELQKTEIKSIGESQGLTPSGKKESQDVCFISSAQTTASYLTGRFGEKEGDIKDFKTKEVLGRHKGAFNYTIGQRKGIGVSASVPLYVVSTDSINNVVYVGQKSELLCSEFAVTDVNWQQPGISGQNSFFAMVKIRYNSPAQAAEIFITGEKEVQIRFNEPKSAVTPGQSAVFYDMDNKYILGGGIIN